MKDYKQIFSLSALRTARLTQTVWLPERDYMDDKMKSKTQIASLYGSTGGFWSAPRLVRSQTTIIFSVTGCGY